MKIDLKNILYPSDFSELSLKALQYATSFAGAYEAQLHCIHVVDEGYQYWMSLGPESVPIGPSIDELTQLAEKHLGDFKASHLAGLHREAITQVLYGRPYVEICQYARDSRTDLIVLATHGRGGLSHALMGGTAEKVVRKAPCPVLTVRDPEHDFVKP